MKTIALLTTLTLGCLTACASASSDDGTNTNGAALSSKTPSKSAPAPAAPAKGAPGIAAKSGSLTIDGTACAIANNELGFDGHGWTLVIDGYCAMEFSLLITGDSAAAYPQTGVKPSADESAASLALTIGNDEPPTLFDATESNIERGPTSHAPATVSGSATVASPGDGTHRLTYTFEY